MSFSISPGITVTETDLTTIIPAVGTTVGAIAGPFRWGPAFKPQLIDSELTEVKVFFQPDNNTANTWFTLADFLAYTGAAQTVRIVKTGNTVSVAPGVGDLTGRGATASLTINSSGVITAVTPVSFGEFYSTVPTVSILGTSGYGATITAILGTGNSGLHPGPTDAVVAYSVGTGGTGYILGHTNATASGVGLLIENEDVYLANYANGQASVGMFAAKYPGDLGNSLAVSLADAQSFATWPYKTSFSGPPLTSNTVALGGGSNDQLHAVVIDSLGYWTGTPDTILETFAFMSKSAVAVAQDGTSVYYPTVMNRQSKYVWWMGQPTATDLGETTLVNGWGGDQTLAYDTMSTKLTYSTHAGTFVDGEIVQDAAALVITPPGSGAAATATAVTGPVVITVTLTNSGGSGYTTPPTVTIADSTNVGGTCTATATVVSGHVTQVVVTNITGISAGDTLGVTIAAPSSGTTATATAVATTPVVVNVSVTGGGGTGYVVAPTVTITDSTTPSGTCSAVATISGGHVTAVTTSSISGIIAGDTLVVSFSVPGSGASGAVTLNGNGKIIAVQVINVGSGYTTAPVVTVSGPGYGALIQAVYSSGTVVGYNIINGGSGYSTVSGKILSHASSQLTIQPLTGVFDIANVTSIVGVTSGATATLTEIDGGAIYKDLEGGIDANALLQDGDYMNGYQLFQSAEDIDVSLIMGADANTDVAQFLISDIAEYRLDCVVFLSPPQLTVVNNAGNEANDIISFRNTLPSSSYAVMDSGWKYQYDKYNDVYRWIPLNGDIAGLCAQTDTTRDPWWSPAGYNRGNIKNIVRLAWNPRKAFRDLMYQSSVNAVISTPGQGTILFGDKTLLAQPSAFDRINVRRLFIVLEKAIATAAKFTLFEFNDAFTQSQFISMVSPYLSDVQARRGIYAFKVVCDSTNNPPQVVDSNEFVGDIYIKPARAINFIQLNFVAVGTGVDFSEIVGGV